MEEAVLSERVEHRVDQSLIVEAPAQPADLDRLARQGADEARQSFARRHRHTDLEVVMAEQSMLGDFDIEQLDRGIEHDERVVG